MIMSLNNDVCEESLPLYIEQLDAREENLCFLHACGIAAQLCVGHACAIGCFGIGCF